MANVELELLSNVIRDGELTVLRRMGFNASHLQSQEAKDLYRWLNEAFMDPARPGVIPSLDRVHRKFPAFDYCPTRDPIEALAQEILSNNVRSALLSAIDEISEMLDEGEDPQEVLGGYLPQMRDLMLHGGEGKHFLLSNAAASMREDFAQMQRTGGITGIPFPWAPLNEATGGMQPEDFIVLYARPKQMKTWIACAVASYAYTMGYRVLVYSKEMAVRVLARRCVSIICQVDYEELKKGSLDPDEAEAVFEMLEDLANWEKSTARGGRRAAMSFISDRDLRRSGERGVTVDVLSAEAERFEADLVIADGFYLMLDGRTNQRSREWKQVGNISSDLKAMAQVLGIPVFGTTQANRGASKTVGDDVDEIGYADAIGQDADLVMRAFKGKNLSTGKPKIMLTFPGTRDSVINPFVVNAWPGTDFSLLQSSVDVNAFLTDKKTTDAEEEEKVGNRPAATGAPATPPTTAGGRKRAKASASKRIR